MCREAICVWLHNPVCLIPLVRRSRNIRHGDIVTSQRDVTFDMTQRIEAQIERFAPGFRDVILCRTARSPSSSKVKIPTWSAETLAGDQMS